MRRRRGEEGKKGRRRGGREERRKEAGGEQDDRCHTEPQNHSYLTLELVTYRLLYGHSICSHSLSSFVAGRQTDKERGTRDETSCDERERRCDSRGKKCFLFAYISLSLASDTTARGYSDRLQHEKRRSESCERVRQRERERERGSMTRVADGGSPSGSLAASPPLLATGNHVWSCVLLPSLFPCIFSTLLPLFTLRSLSLSLSRCHSLSRVATILRRKQHAIHTANLSP